MGETAAGGTRIRVGRGTFLTSTERNLGELPPFIARQYAYVAKELRALDLRLKRRAGVSHLTAFERKVAWAREPTAVLLACDAGMSILARHRLDAMDRQEVANRLISELRKIDGRIAAIYRARFGPLLWSAGTEWDDLVTSADALLYERVLIDEDGKRSRPTHRSYHWRVWRIFNLYAAATVAQIAEWEGVSPSAIKQLRRRERAKGCITSAS